MFKLYFQNILNVSLPKFALEGNFLILCHYFQSLILLAMMFALFLVSFFRCFLNIEQCNFHLLKVHRKVKAKILKAIDILVKQFALEFSL